MSRPFLFVIALAALAMAAWPGHAAEDDPIIARVNGTDIPRSEILDARNRLPPQYQQMPVEMLMPLLVNIVIDTKLLAGEARRQGLDKGETVVRQMARLEELLLEQALLTDQIEPQLTDEALRARYEGVVAEAAKREQVRARHILLETEAEALDVITELQEGGDFAELAKTRSVGPSAESGGDLGYFGAGEMVAGFSDAAFAMEVGAFSEAPVQTQFGWHVIKVEDRRKAEPPAFEQVADQLRGELAHELRAGYVNDLREAATIERFDQPAPAEETPAEPATEPAEPSAQ